MCSSGLEYYRKVRVTGITWADAISARWNGISIKPNLKNSGIDYRLLIGSKPQLDEDWIRPAFPSYDEASRLLQMTMALESKSGYQSRLQTWTRQILKNEFYKDADLIHLHIIHNGWFRLEFLKKIGYEKKMIWSLHDPWLTTGHCIYPYNCVRWELGCGECPDLGRPLAVGRDRTKYEVERKLRLIEDVEVDFVVSTNWLLEKVIRAGIPKEKLTLLPFGINTTIFKPDEESRGALRRRFLIPDNAIVAAMRVTTEPQKGLKIAIESLSEINREIVIFAVDQKGRLGNLYNKHGIIEFGWINDEYFLADILRAADVFLMPSIAETFGFMALEAMSCGTPVIYFAETAIHEVVSAPPEFAVTDKPNALNLTKALQFIFSNPELIENESNRVRKRATDLYNLENYSNNTKDLYLRCAQN